MFCMVEYLKEVKNKYVQNTTHLDTEDNDKIKLLACPHHLYGFAISRSKSERRLLNWNHRWIGALWKTFRFLHP